MPLIIASPPSRLEIPPPFVGGAHPGFARSPPLTPPLTPAPSPGGGGTAGWGIAAMVVMGFVGVPVLRVMLGLF